MNMMSFWRRFKVFTFFLFSSFMGLAIIGTPSVDVGAISATIIFGLGLCLLYYVWEKIRPLEFKARVVEKTLGDNEFGQRCYAVEIDGMVLSEITWLPIRDTQIVELRDILPCNKKLTVRLTIMEFGKFSRIYIIMCGQPPHVYNNVYS